MIIDQNSFEIQTLNPKIFRNQKIQRLIYCYQSNHSNFLCSERNILKTFKEIDIDHPFRIWHLAEHPIIVSATNYAINFGVPVASRTLHLPRQTRFRLDHYGNILDFDRMTEKEKEAYMEDEEEQERQRSPGRRHRNHETIRCRYSTITSEAKILESRERIRKRTQFTPKLLRYQTARKCPQGGEVNNNLQHQKTQNGSASNGRTSNDPPKDATTSAHLDDLKGFDPNPDGKLVLYIHGG